MNLVFIKKLKLHEKINAFGHLEVGLVVQFSLYYSNNNHFHTFCLWSQFQARNCDHLKNKFIHFFEMIKTSHVRGRSWQWRAQAAIFQEDTHRKLFMELFLGGSAEVSPSSYRRQRSFRALFLPLILYIVQFLTPRPHRPPLLFLSSFL